MSLVLVYGCDEEKQKVPIEQEQAQMEKEMVPIEIEKK